ncbi:helix-turn-helix transcriptional regulator [Clostridium sp. D2Q-14]|uniref:helix-turn-helix domain-containing protein n=1 Tax=Anaeromonas gelatinilytica TaxID=2683194 RepID=UPI00193C75DB|nr:helix-turn-helix transcriptional regulator [Anaeromonas gelatinilytica]MBS4535178.1 helix-turn-helix transcriptional regulator [Anaeromonas gelatinilytica]
MQTIGDRIKSRRIELNMTQKELSEKAQITEATLSRYENNLREPKAEIIINIAKALNTSTDKLMGVSSPSNEYDLTEEELEILEQIKNDPEISILFHDLKSAPKKKIKQLIKTWEFLNEQFDEMDDEE